MKPTGMEEAGASKKLVLVKSYSTPARVFGWSIFLRVCPLFFFFRRWVSRKFFVVKEEQEETSYLLITSLPPSCSTSSSTHPTKLESSTYKDEIQI